MSNYHDTYRASFDDPKHFWQQIGHPLKSWTAPVSGECGDVDEGDGPTVVMELGAGSFDAVEGMSAGHPA
ncbi:hypothetical protein [Streptosporangium sp. 'caverna']|uniref:hypothetical protein n=1 Tax=Streptosporangium sp. 'caverna' TaxID=2202249 RepID=UPI0013A6ECCA|nr:hypothetical protein [Streptosporangium sp. 'caverna']